MEIIASIISLLMGLSTKVIINRFLPLNWKKLNRKFEYDDKSPFQSTKFESDFILPSLKEKYFQMETGIRTNEKSIDKYVAFKNKLGENYTWREIKLAQPYLSLAQDEIEIKLTRFDIIRSNIVIILSFIFLITSIVGASYFSQFKISTLQGLLIYGMIVLVPMGIGYFLVLVVNSVILSKQMDKKLNNHI
tara:strand:- start:7850 stop:8422 length:573 start_codon:yes stop_codon:yes gene_type:complete